MVEGGDAMKTRLVISYPRILAAFALLSALLGLIIFLVRQLPDSATGWGVAFALGVVALPVAASPWEWLVHRYVYHRVVIPFLRRIYEIHHKGHHGAIFPTWRYVTNGPVRRHPIGGASVSELHTLGWRNATIKLGHFAFYFVLGSGVICVPAWILTESAPFLIGLYVSLVMVSDLFVRVHDAIHYPGLHPWIERQQWFRFLEVHHYIHHVDMEANVNFLLPLADWLFGTMRRTLTDEELVRHGSLEEAKANPVGMSEPAIEVAHSRRHIPQPGA